MTGSNREKKKKPNNTFCGQGKQEICEQLWGNTADVQESHVKPSCDRQELLSPPSTSSQVRHHLPAVEVKRRYYTSGGKWALVAT